VFAGSAVFVSPLELYWSLAFEEQFDLLWPLAVAFLAGAAVGGLLRRWAVPA
jgi:peptidoglycan/LPS O-acetylase OafA/YrhL